MLPPLDTLCKAIEEFPDDLPIHFPGGAQLVPHLEGLPPSLFAMAQHMLGQANAALAPLNPIFDVIETIVALKDCITAIKDALGPPPDPSKMAECLPDLAAKVEVLLALLPPASVLRTIAEILDVLIALLQGIVIELGAVVALLRKVTEAEDSSGRIGGLAAVVHCGRLTATASMNNIGRALRSANAFVELLNGLTSLAGLPRVPSLGAMPDDPTEAVAQLQAVVDVLRTFRDGIALG